MIRKVFFFVFLIIPLVSYAQTDSTENKITFRVFSKPTPYDAKVYITGNQVQLHNWTDPGTQLEELSAGVWEKTFFFEKGTQLEYDFNLGSFESIGLDSSGKMLGDSLFHAGNIAQHTHSFLEVKTDTTVTRRIPQWRQGEIYLFANALDTTSVWLDVLWKYFPGDNEKWTNPEFDDSEWEITKTWLNPNNLPKSGWNGIGWFRIHMVVDSILWNRPLALNVRQLGASEIYLDGSLVAQFGKVGSSERDEEDYIARNPDFLPPPKSIVFGKTNHVIAVRFSNFYFTENYPKEPLGLRIVLSDLNSTIVSSAGQRRTNTIMQMVFTIVPVVFAVLHLMLFLFYRRTRENLYYALFTLMFGILAFAGLQKGFSMVTDFQQGLLFERLGGAVRLFVFIAGLRFSYAIFYPRLPKQFWIFLLIGAVMVISDWSHPFSELNYAMEFIIITLLEMLRVTVVAILGKKDGAWIIGTGFIIFTVTFILELLLPLTFNLSIAFWLSGIFGLLLSMSVFLARNISRTEVDNARKTHELEEARQLQLSMLPKELPQLPHLDIGVFMNTATEVGGDYYDFKLHENGTLTAVIGDATGHGMQAGTMVAATKSLFNAIADEPEPIKFLKKGTKAIKAMGLKKMFMALTIAKFKDHHMQVAAAGMPFTLVYSASTGRVEQLALKGMPLGGVADFPYQEKKLQLSEGDTVLFLSDGFEEMFNPQDEMLGDEQVKKLFEAVAAKSAEEIIEHLKKAGEAWANGRAQEDDVTFVVIKVK